MFDLAKQYKDQEKDVLFKLYFKSKTGASLSIDYAIDAMSLNAHLSSSKRSNLFKKYTYNWINRSFRSNIPFEDWFLEYGQQTIIAPFFSNWGWTSLSFAIQIK